MTNRNGQPPHGGWPPSIARRLAVLALLILPALTLAQDNATLEPGVYPQSYNALLQTPALSDILSPLLSLRDDALRADAYLYAAAEWKRAEDRLGGIAQNLARGKIEAAQKRAGETAMLYQQARLSATETTVLGEVKAAYANAQKQKLEREIPRTMAHVSALMAQARQSLLNDIDDVPGARALAEQAMAELTHGRWLQQRIASANETNGAKGASEAIMLEWEQVIGSVSEATGTTADFSAGPHLPAQAIVSAIASLEQRIAALEGELEARNTQIRGLQAQLTASGEELDTIARQRTALEDTLAAQARVREQFTAIEQMFDEGEAEVTREGKRLLVRLIGLSFDSGSTEVTEDQQPVLDKVIAAINVFPNSRVTVEGHTDSRGRDETNMTLSRDRAHSVRDYLLSLSGIVSTRVTSDGYGETQPIASNDSEEGRARNRRIEVRIDPRLGSAVP